VISSNLPSNLANLVAPFNAVGREPVGYEDPSAKISPIKPVEQSAANVRQQLYTREHNDAGVGVASAPDETLGETPNAGDVQAEGSTPPSDRQQRAEQAAERQQQEQEQRQIEQLSARDREVRQHERAHAAVGGQYAGAAEYQYERGPNGVLYAVSGEVPIDVGREATPLATLQKAETVKRAALAPAEPSPQDRRVAAEATRLGAEARRELSVANTEETTAEEDSEVSPVEDTNDIPLVSSSTSSDSESNTESNSAAREVGIDAIRSGNAILTTRLNQGIANASLSSSPPGSILDQIV